MYPLRGVTETKPLVGLKLCEVTSHKQPRHIHNVGSRDL